MNNPKYKTLIPCVEHVEYSAIVFPGGFGIVEGKNVTVNGKLVCLSPMVQGVTLDVPNKTVKVRKGEGEGW